MIYLYGLIEDAAPGIAAEISDTPGLQAPLQCHPVGPWTLVASDHDDAEILPKRRLLLAHTRVVERLLECGTVLPARFGLVASDLATVRAMIVAKGAVIDAEFARVRGCVELGIRVSFPRQPALAATLAADAGLRRDRERLLNRGPEAHFAMAEFGGKLADQLDRRRAAAQAQVLRTVLPLCRSHVLRVPQEDTEVLRAEFLVERRQQAALLAAVEDVASRLDFAPGTEPEIAVVGPVPMYNFVRLSLAFDPETEAA